MIKVFFICSVCSSCAMYNGVSFDRALRASFGARIYRKVISKVEDDQWLFFHDPFVVTPEDKNITLCYEMAFYEPLHCLDKVISDLLNLPEEKSNLHRFFRLLERTGRYGKGLTLSLQQVYVLLRAYSLLDSPEVFVCNKKLKNRIADDYEDVIDRHHDVICTPALQHIARVDGTDWEGPWDRFRDILDVKIENSPYYRG